MRELYAILPGGHPTNAKQPDNKRLIHAVSVIGRDDKGMKEVVCARFWMGLSSSSTVVQCCVWVYPHGHCMSGRGEAGGGGYCKKSSALDCALQSAGIRVASRESPSWQLAGSGCIREACEAVAAALGYTEIYTVNH